VERRPEESQVVDGLILLRPVVRSSAPGEVSGKITAVENSFDIVFAHTILPP
jgi:hypothetical protein